MVVAAARFGATGAAIEGFWLESQYEAPKCPGQGWLSPSYSDRICMFLCTTSPF